MIRAAQLGTEKTYTVAMSVRTRKVLLMLLAAGCALVAGVHFLRPEWQRHFANGEVVQLSGWVWEKPAASEYFTVSSNWLPNTCLGFGWLAVAIFHWRLVRSLSRHPDLSMQTSAPSSARGGSASPVTRS